MTLVCCYPILEGTYSTSESQTDSSDSSDVCGRPANLRQLSLIRSIKIILKIILKILTMRGVGCIYNELLSYSLFMLLHMMSKNIMLSNMIYADDVGNDD